MSNQSSPSHITHTPIGKDMLLDCFPLQKRGPKFPHSHMSLSYGRKQDVHSLSPGLCAACLLPFMYHEPEYSRLTHVKCFADPTESDTTIVVWAKGR